jgi:hypothetical protein
MKMGFARYLSPRVQRQSDGPPVLSLLCIFHGTYYFFSSLRAERIHTHTKKKSHTSAHYQNGVWGTLEHVAVGIDGKIKGVSSMCAVCDFVELLLEKQNKMEHIPPFCG